MKDDFISRKAAIDALTREAELDPWDYSAWDAIATVKTVPSAQPEPQWIPFDNSKPDDFEDVLIFAHIKRNGNPTMLIGWFDPDGNLNTMQKDIAKRIGKVIAWMPLPEAPGPCEYKDGDKEWK